MLQLMRSFSLLMVEGFGNAGIAAGLTIGVLILLRPLLVRVLRPKYRVIVWMAAWLLSYSPTFYGATGMIHLLPVTLRSWIAPSAMGTDGRPLYIPNLIEAGEKTISFPGGKTIPVVLTEEMQGLLALFAAAGLLLTLWWINRSERKIKKLIRQGEPMSREWHEAHGISNPMIEVRIMEGLPTSFVYRGNMKTNICLQKELPAERMELILRHEMTHLEEHHVWFKGILVVAMSFYWWNPIMWVAYRLACRDIELACDEMVLAQLDDRQRREYARTLVELGSGKQLWGGLTCFGECDAQLRVKNAVNWKREWKGMKVLFWPVLIFGMMFLFTTPNSTQEQRDAAWERYVAEQLAEDLDHGITRGKEIVEIRVSYSPNSNHLLLRTQSGEWILSTAGWKPNRKTYGINHSIWPVDPDRYQNFVPLESWG